MEALRVAKKFYTRLWWFFNLCTLILVDLRTDLTGKMCLFAVPLELISCLGESHEIQEKKLQQQENILRGRGTTISHKTPYLTVFYWGYFGQI